MLRSSLELQARVVSKQGKYCGWKVSVCAAGAQIGECSRAGQEATTNRAAANSSPGTFHGSKSRPFLSLMKAVFYANLVRVQSQNGSHSYDLWASRTYVLVDAAPIR